MAKGFRWIIYYYYYLYIYMHISSFSCPPHFHIQKTFFPLPFTHKSSRFPLLLVRLLVFLCISNFYAESILSQDTLDRESTTHTRIIYDQICSFYCLYCSSMCLFFLKTQEAQGGERSLSNQENTLRPFFFYQTQSLILDTPNLTILTELK